MAQAVQDATREGAVIAGDFESFYAAAYPRVVATLLRTAGSRHEAEDLAQEAFSRLVTRWDQVGRYDDPEAWVRTVAFRLMTSRWRRARTAARGALRIGPQAPVEPAWDDAMTVSALLSRLTLEHRQVLVLHHGLGLSVEEVGHELGIATGTVKSRLSRARAAAARGQEGADRG
jgi:RNA polymerase sigma-70 factor (ECF subfamily)